MCYRIYVENEIVATLFSLPQVASEIMNLIKCDRKTANAMIMHKRDNLKALVARM